MKYAETGNIIGLAAAREEVERVCAEAHIYARCGLRPDHLILNLDPGEGRTKLACWMTDMYRASHVLKFGSGLDDYLEFSFDGTLQQMRRVFREMEAAAIYENYRTEPVFLGISAMAAHQNEAQCAEMLMRLKEFCRYGYAVFFVSGEPSYHEERLIAKIEETVAGVRRITLERYTLDELAAIAVDMMKERGIRVVGENYFCKAIAGSLEACRIQKVRDVAPFTERLVRYADFSAFFPTISREELDCMMREEAYMIRGRNL